MGKSGRVAQGLIARSAAVSEAAAVVGHDLVNHTISPPVKTRTPLRLGWTSKSRSSGGGGGSLGRTFPICYLCTGTNEKRSMKTRFVSKVGIDPYNGAWTGIYQVH